MPDKVSALTNNKRGKKVAIIGADGYIGNALIKQLTKHEDLSFILTSRKTGQTKADGWMMLNLNEKASWQRLHESEPDVVVLLAAMTQIAACEQQPELARSLNVTATLALMTQFHEAGIPVIWLSTNQVFGCDEPFVAAEQSFKPCSFYGQLKAEVEQSIAEQGLNVAVIRPGKVIGPEFGLFQHWESQLLQGNTVEAFTDHVIAPVSLDRLLQLIERLVYSPVSGVYQLSGVEDLSYFELIQRFIKFFGFSADNIAECRALSKGVKPLAFGSLQPHSSDDLPLSGVPLDEVFNDYAKGR